MARKIVQPVTEPHGDGTKTTHPAFGQITVHRVQGATNLYGSDFTHHGFVSVAISRSEMHRNLSRDWHFARGEIVEVWLSEAQWATFVSSFNLGSGVPCTIASDHGEIVPGLPERKTFKLYAEEASESMAETIAKLRALEENMVAATSKLSKKAQDEVMRSVRDAIATLTSSIPFVRQSFDQHIEEGVERAKVEVNAYMMNAVREAGLQALATPQTPLLIEEKKDAGQ